MQRNKQNNTKETKIDNALSAELKRIGQKLIKNQDPLAKEFANVLNNQKELHHGS